MLPTPNLILLIIICSNLLCICFKSFATRSILVNDRNDAELKFVEFIKNMNKNIVILI